MIKNGELVCDKCRKPGDLRGGKCDACGKEYVRCEACGGAAGIKRSLHSHAGVYHPKKEVPRG